jgi:hypothetical protein
MFARFPTSHSSVERGWWGLRDGSARIVKTAMGFGFSLQVLDSMFKNRNHLAVLAD